MKYIVLLRGINISGKNIISMKSLKEEIELLGYKNVITYLNSGNIILESEDNENNIENNIYNMIVNKFKLNIPILIIEENKLKELINNKPDWWMTGNKEIYDNIIFIISPRTYNEIYNSLGMPNEKLEKIKEYKNNIFWSYSLKDYRKTNWWSKTASTDIKDYITIRTGNTVTKLLKLCDK